MLIPVQVDYRLITDLFVSAFEGGSNYWINRVSLIQGKPTTRPWYDDPDLYKQDFLIKIRVDDEAEPRHLVEASIHHGLSVMAERYGWHFGNLLSGDWDAETADVFLQLCLFGDIIYG